MKKNLLTVITLALVLVNLVLTVILTITIVPETKQANELITKVCSAIDLDLESGSATSNANISIDQITTVDLTDTLTINLKKGEDGKDHYAMIAVTLSLNNASEDYETINTQVSEKEKLIASEINNIVSNYTLDEIRNNQESLQEEILKDLQKMFGSDCIVGVGFSSIQYQ